VDDGINRMQGKRGGESSRAIAAARGLSRRCDEVAARGYDERKLNKRLM